MALFRRTPPAAPTPPPEPSDDGVESVASYVDTALRGAFRTRAEVLEQALELAEDEDVPADVVERLVAERWAARLVEQATWTGRSDSDRLDDAFAALEAQGVAARMDFSCCGTCAPGELAAEVGDDPTRTGYVYFHMQDAEALADGYGLMLGYGSLRRFGSGRDWDEQAYGVAAVAVGEQVRAALEAQGLTVTWDGSLERRIAVERMDWRRRLPTG